MAARASSPAALRARGGGADHLGPPQVAAPFAPERVLAQRVRRGAEGSDPRLEAPSGRPVTVPLSAGPGTNWYDRHTSSVRSRPAGAPLQGHPRAESGGPAPGTELLAAQHQLHSERREPRLHFLVLGLALLVEGLFRSWQCHLARNDPGRRLAEHRSEVLESGISLTCSLG